MSKNIQERRKEILSMVNELGTIEFSAIKEMYPNISEVTLRKDLAYLDETNQLMRTHGGAKSIPSALYYFYRSNINIAEKQVIARKAVNLINEMEDIFISAGTTCAELAKILPDFPLRVVSDGVYTVSNISNLPNISVQLLGGDVDLNIMRVEGLSVLNALENMHFTTAFLGAFAIHPELGYSHNSSMTAAILEKVIEHSDRVIMLAHSEKFNYSFTQYRIPVSHIGTIVTTDKVDKNFLRNLENKGITIM